MVPSMARLAFTLEMDDESCRSTSCTCHDPHQRPTDIMVPLMARLTFTLEMDDESCRSTSRTCHGPHQWADRHHDPLNGPTVIHTGDG